MNKRGEVFQFIIKMALGLTLFIIAYLILTNFTSNFKSSTKVCQGMCLEASACGDSEGESIWHPGNPSCDEGKVCCQSDEITELISQGELPLGDTRIGLIVSDVHGTFFNGQGISLFIGSRYNFNITVSSEELKSKACELLIKDSNGRIPKISDKNGQDVALREALFYDTPCHYDNETLRLLTRDSRSDFKDIAFEGDHLGKGFVLEFIIYNERVGGQKLATARFPISLELPVTVSGLTGRWSNEEKIEVMCEDIACRQFDFAFTKGESCETLDYKYGSSFGDDQDLKFKLDEESFGQEGQILNGALCYRAVLDNDEVMYWKSSKPLKLDFQAPIITGFNRAQVECNDREGSGCEEYYYNVIQDYGYDDWETASATDSLREAFYVSVSNKIKAFIREGANLQACAQQGDPRYRLSRDGFIDTKGSVYGTVCVYARDRAGNEGEAVFKTYRDDLIITDEILERFEIMPEDINIEEGIHGAIDDATSLTDHHE